MPDQTTYYKISERKLKELLEIELIYTALDNADVDKWEKYNGAIKDFKDLIVSHYLPQSSDIDILKKIAEIKMQDYKKV